MFIQWLFISIQTDIVKVKLTAGYKDNTRDNTQFFIKIIFVVAVLTIQLRFWPCCDFDVGTLVIEISALESLWSGGYWVICILKIGILIIGNLESSKITN